MASGASRKVRAGIWTAGFAGIAATGAWFGASLKSDAQTKKQVTQIIEATPSERIHALEEQKSGLLSKRILLEQKLEQIAQRQNGATREESLVGQGRRRPGE